MNGIKVIVAAFIGTVSSGLAGLLFYQFLLKDYLSSHITGMSQEPNYLLVGLGHFFFALLMAYVFIYWAGIKTVRQGAFGGFLMGLLVTLGSNSFALGAMSVYSGIAPAIIDAFIAAAVWMAGGAGIGWWLGRED